MRFRHSFEGVAIGLVGVLKGRGCVLHITANCPEGFVFKSVDRYCSRSNSSSSYPVLPTLAT